MTQAAKLLLSLIYFPEITSIAGCTVNADPPVEGDVRLVPVNDNPTEPCDDIHFGAVELFRQERWGRICSFLDDDFTIDAQVPFYPLPFASST